MEKTNATSYRIDHPQHSYGIFIITEKGDLFITSDWGYYTFSWRAFGDNFKAFLIGLGADYLLSKLESNQRQFLGVSKKINKRQAEALIALFTEFQEQLKTETII
jgi:hypothetical protein